MHIKIIPSPLGSFLILPSCEMFKDGIEEGGSVHVFLIPTYVYNMKNRFRNICVSVANIILMSRQTRL